MPFISYANCRLSDHVGDAIEEESHLLVATEQRVSGPFAIDCRMRSELVDISSEQKTVKLRNHLTGQDTTEHYDRSCYRPEQIQSDLRYPASTFGESTRPAPYPVPSTSARREKVLDHAVA